MNKNLHMLCVEVLLALIFFAGCTIGADGNHAETPEENISLQNDTFYITLGIDNADIYFHSNWIGEYLSYLRTVTHDNTWSIGHIQTPLLLTAGCILDDGNPKVVWSKNAVTKSTFQVVNPKGESVHCAVQARIDEQEDPRGVRFISFIIEIYEGPLQVRYYHRFPLSCILQNGNARLSIPFDGPVLTSNDMTWFSNLVILGKE